MTEEAASATVFSLSAEHPASLPAGSHGTEGVLDAGWLVGPTASEGCLIRKLSAAGATLRLPAPAPEGPLSLQLANGQSLAGTLIWHEGDEAGFLFDERIDVIGSLARNLATLPAERRRVPRVELRQTVGIRRGAEFEFGRTRNVSQAGVGIECELALEPGDAVQIAFDGLRPLTGVVKWVDGAFAGIAFDNELGWQVLMPWLRQAQKAPVHGGYAPAPIHATDEQRGFGLRADKTAICLDTPARVREGVRWWNVELRCLTANLVEFRSGASFARGAPLWLSLSGFAGWPATVIEADDGHYLAEFRIPLRKHDLDMLAPPRVAQR